MSCVPNRRISRSRPSILLKRRLHHPHHLLSEKIEKTRFTTYYCSRSGHATCCATRGKRKVTGLGCVRTPHAKPIAPRLVWFIVCHTIILQGHFARILGCGRYLSRGHGDVEPSADGGNDDRAFGLSHVLRVRELEREKYGVHLDRLYR